MTVECLIIQSAAAVCRVLPNRSAVFIFTLLYVRPVPLKPVRRGSRQKGRVGVWEEKGVRDSHKEEEMEGGSGMGKGP